MFFVKRNHRLNILFRLVRIYLTSAVDASTFILEKSMVWCRDTVLQNRQYCRHWTCTRLSYVCPWHISVFMCSNANYNNCGFMILMSCVFHLTYYMQIPRDRLRTGDVCSSCDFCGGRIVSSCCCGGRIDSSSYSCCCSSSESRGSPARL